MIQIPQFCCRVPSWLWVVLTAQALTPFTRLKRETCNHVNRIMLQAIPLPRIILFPEAPSSSSRNTPYIHVISCVPLESNMPSVSHSPFHILHDILRAIFLCVSEYNPTRAHFGYISTSIYLYRHKLPTVASTQVAPPSSIPSVQQFPLQLNWD